MIVPGAKGWGIMRRRLGRFLPIVMLAMLVQIFAPVAACLAFGPITADPLASAICSHTDSTLAQDGETDPQQTHGACCALCGVVHHATAPPPDPLAVAVSIERNATVVVWRGLTFGLPPFAIDANAQARAPPSMS